MPLTERNHDKDLCRRRLIAALLGIVHGVGLTDQEGHPTIVPVLTSLRMAAIVDALRDAAQHLDEDFDEHDFRTVDRACEALGIQRITDRKNQVARTILDGLIAETIDSRKAYLAEFEPGSMPDKGNPPFGFTRIVEHLAQVEPRKLAWLATGGVSVIAMQAGLIIGLCLTQGGGSKTYETASTSEAIKSVAQETGACID